MVLLIEIYLLYRMCELSSFPILIPYCETLRLLLTNHIPESILHNEIVPLISYTQPNFPIVLWIFVHSHIKPQITYYIINLHN